MSLVKVVHGAPASGKTTYVKEHMERGDLIVDLDYIKQAISWQAKDDCPYALLGLAIDIRDYIIGRIVSGRIHVPTIWIVTCMKGDKLEDFLEELEGLEVECVYIEATFDECMKRAMQDKERTNKEKQLEIILQYFGGFD